MYAAVIRVAAHTGLRMGELRALRLAVRVFPLSDVQPMMGHADLPTTMKYVHYVPQRDAGQRLSQAFAVEVGPGILVSTPP
jgi:integrase